MFTIIACFLGFLDNHWYAAGKHRELPALVFDKNFNPRQGEVCVDLWARHDPNVRPVFKVVPPQGPLRALISRRIFGIGHAPWQNI